jgi:hypothetical protein
MSPEDPIQRNSRPLPQQLLKKQNRSIKHLIFLEVPLHCSISAQIVPNDRRKIDDRLCPFGAIQIVIYKVKIRFGIIRIPNLIQAN